MGTAIFNHSPRMSDSAMVALLGENNAFGTTSSPVVHTNQAYSAHSFIRTGWMPQVRYLSIAKFQSDSGPRFTYGGLHFLFRNQTTHTAVANIYVGLSDSFAYAFPNTIPRLQLKEDNWGDDNWPPAIGVDEIGEYLRVFHDPSGITFPWLDHREALESALSSSILGTFEVPQRIKRPCESFIVRADAFTPADLRALGLLNSPSDVYDTAFNMVSTVKADLALVTVIPVTTQLDFVGSVPDIYHTDTKQNWSAREPYKGVEDTSVTPPETCTVAQSATAMPPWSDSFLRYLWGITVTAEVPVPTASSTVVVRAPQTRFLADAIEYGVVTTQSPGAIALVLG